MATTSQYEEMAQQCERYAASRRFKADTEAWNAVAKMWRTLAATIDPLISSDAVVDRTAESPPSGSGGLS
jgi:hypothetical protein